MALSPEDVIKKSFKPTHLKRGYDETEVDDFLDEVVVELRRVGSEVTTLRTDLDDCRVGRGLEPGSVPATGDDTGSAELEDEQDQVARLQREREELSAEVAELTQQAELRRAEADDPQARADAAAPQESDVDGTGAQRTAGPGADPASIISLAQRLHDEHVAEGESTKVRLIGEAESYRDRVVGEADERGAELVSSGQRRHDELVESGQQQHDELVQTGQTTHDRLVGEGEQTRDEMVREAEQRRTDVLADLTTRQESLNGTIEELTFFESDYRGKLRGLLSEQLSRLDQEERAPQ